MSEEMTNEHAVMIIDGMTNNGNDYNLNKIEFAALVTAMDALETVMRLKEYLDNPHSGKNGLVHIDDVRGVMEGYEA